MDDIKKLRKKIDTLDNKIINLIKERALTALKVGEIKKLHNIPLYVPEREQEIYERIKATDCTPISSESLINIFREIISACRSLEEKLKIAYLGPMGTFTHLAATKYFGLSEELVALTSISEVFEEVDKGRANFGVIPIENSLEGVVNYAIDMFLESNLKICGELYTPVSHNLMNKSGLIEDVKKVFSHPHAIAQCKNFIGNKLAHISIVEVESTAKAAEIASKDTGASAIASEVAASLYGLKIIYKGIEDELNNFTRFLVIAKDSNFKGNNAKTSLMFSVPHKAGSLYEALEVFAKNCINMTKIESRPSKKKAWDYVFFVDIDGHIDNEKIKKAINEFSKRVAFLKILGSYRKGEI